ncbi:hypothetical protein ACFY36_20385 [Actinoplanes sp. NPDC000266]
MRVRRIWFSAAAMMAAGVLAGCGDTEQAPEAIPTTTSPQAKANAIAAAEKAAGIPPKPDDKTAAAYIAALRKINPDIVGDKDLDRIIDRGRDQCVSIKEFTDDEAKVLKFANSRFTSPDHPEGFGNATAKKINLVVKKYICPGS